MVIEFCELFMSPHSGGDGRLVMRLPACGVYDDQQLLNAAAISKVG